MGIRFETHESCETHETVDIKKTEGCCATANYNTRVFFPKQPSTFFHSFSLKNCFLKSN